MVDEFVYECSTAESGAEFEDFGSRGVVALPI
jgi:hypothetical protein